eukprot:CAMPEP_0170510576 /NCGR_PEP_ID=MMETSP0208-20121228/65842_1 /TAXON_ID=197538 /ORGANISM="Strombidium inclinatum, Strain S3" /LENGTH=61 /DNA_ID=CAMNT_0010794053 /DNA_START=1042 /DNA_END=1227 /DNA_ORIENTATION=-
MSSKPPLASSGEVPSPEEIAKMQKELRILRAQNENLQLSLQVIREKNKNGGGDAEADKSGS